MKIKDNKVIQLPNCFEALCQKATVEYEGQSSYKVREPVERQRPSSSQPLTEDETKLKQNAAEKQTKKKKNRKHSARLAPPPRDVTEHDGLAAVTMKDGNDAVPQTQTDISFATPGQHQTAEGELSLEVQTVNSDNHGNKMAEQNRMKTGDQQITINA